MSYSGAFEKIVSNRLTDPLQLWKKAPELTDPLNITGAQDVKADKEEEARRQKRIAQAGTLQQQINKQYGLQGQTTILGG